MFVDLSMVAGVVLAAQPLPQMPVTSPLHTEAAALSLVQYAQASDLQPPAADQQELGKPDAAQATAPAPVAAQGPSTSGTLPPVSFARALQVNGSYQLVHDLPLPGGAGPRGTGSLIVGSDPGSPGGIRIDRGDTSQFGNVAPAGSVVTIRIEIIIGSIRQYMVEAETPQGEQMNGIVDAIDFLAAINP